MLPVQNFNGYDRPWAGGMGSNQLDFDNATLNRATVSGTADDFTLTVTGNAASNINFPLPDSFAGQTLYLSGTITRTGTSVTNVAAQLVRTEDGAERVSPLASYTDGTAELSDIEVAILASATNIRVRVVAAGTNDTLTDPPITVNAQNLRLCAEQGQSWSPYANICPIYGHTGATVYRTGKNILPKRTIGETTQNGITFTVNGDGTIIVNGTATAAAVYAIQNHNQLVSAGLGSLAGQQFTMSGCPVGGSTSSYRMAWYNSDQPLTWLSDTGSGSTGTMMDLDANPNMSLTIRVASGTVCDNLLFKPMIRPVSDTDATFEPYNGDTYTISFGDTVYGGTLDFTTGVLTATWGYIASYNGEALPAEWISDRDVYAAGTTPTTGAAVAYKLATPQTIQVTPQEITTLLGTNNIWATTETNEP